MNAWQETFNWLRRVYHRWRVYTQLLRLLQVLVWTRQLSSCYSCGLFTSPGIYLNLGYLQVDFTLMLTWVKYGVIKV